MKPDSIISVPAIMTPTPADSLMRMLMFLLVQILGYVGMTGNTSTPHVHWEIRADYNSWLSEHIDPKSFFTGG